MDQKTPHTVRVLWIDDNIEILSLYKRLLMDDDLDHVGFLSTVANIKNEIATRSPDIVVLDYRLPGFDSLAVMQSCLSVFPSLRFLVVSVDDASGIIESALDAGATGFHLKDGDLPALVACLRRVAATPFRI